MLEWINGLSQLHGVLLFTLLLFVVFFGLILVSAWFDKKWAAMNEENCQDDSLHKHQVLDDPLDRFRLADIEIKNASPSKYRAYSHHPLSQKEPPEIHGGMPTDSQDNRYD